MYVHCNDISLNVITVAMYNFNKNVNVALKIINKHTKKKQ